MRKCMSGFAVRREQVSLSLVMVINSSFKGKSSLLIHHCYIFTMFSTADGEPAAVLVIISHMNGVSIEQDTVNTGWAVCIHRCTHYARKQPLLLLLRCRWWNNDFYSVLSLIKGMSVIILCSLVVMVTEFMIACVILCSQILPSSPPSSCLIGPWLSFIAEISLCWIIHRYNLYFDGLLGKTPRKLDFWTEASYCKQLLNHDTHVDFSSLVFVFFIIAKYNPRSCFFQTFNIVLHLYIHAYTIHMAIKEHKTTIFICFP